MSMIDINKINRLKQILDRYEKLDNELEELRTTGSLFDRNYELKGNGKGMFFKDKTEYQKRKIDIEKEKNLIELEISGMGIEFDCEDCGGGYCLNLSGLMQLFRDLEIND